MSVQEEIIEEHTFDTGIVSINYAEGPPSGSPMVLLHGGSGSWKSFLPVIPDLASKWHVYAPDARGHGKSGHVAGAYRYVDHAQDTIAFLRGQVSAPAVLWGQSTGAMIAIAAAAKAPDTVRAVVLEEPPLDHQRAVREVSQFLEPLKDLAGSDLTLEEMKHAVEDIRIKIPGRDEPVRVGELRDPRTIQWTAESLMQTDPGVYTSLLDGSATDGYDLDTFLQQVSCPALLLRANPALGGRIPEETATRAIALLARGTLVNIPEAEHNIHQSQPKAAVEAVTRFLESM